MTCWVDHRNVRGIEVNDETLSLEVIANVCVDGPGHYLGNEQTLALMQKEYVYPQVANRMSPKEWNEAGNRRLSSGPPRESARSFPPTIPTTFHARLTPRSVRSTISSCRVRSWNRDPRWA